MEDVASFRDDSSISSSQSLLVDNEKAIDFETDERGLGRRFLPWIPHFVSAFLFLTSIIIFLASGKSNLECVKRQASWCMKYIYRSCWPLLLTARSAPALEAVLPFATVQFNGTLDYPSPFRGQGPSVDAAWETIVNRETSMASSLISRSKTNQVATNHSWCVRPLASRIRETQHIFDSRDHEIGTTSRWWILWNTRGLPSAALRGM